ncbi:hypothetical protein ACG7TL_008445 [Trametes sanguinea]
MSVLQTIRATASGSQRARLKAARRPTNADALHSSKAPQHGTKRPLDKGNPEDVNLTPEVLLVTEARGVHRRVAARHGRKARVGVVRVGGRRTG